MKYPSNVLIKRHVVRVKQRFLVLLVGLLLIEFGRSNHHQWLAKEARLSGSRDVLFARLVNDLVVRVGLPGAEVVGQLLGLLVKQHSRRHLTHLAAAETHLVAVQTNARRALQHAANRGGVVKRHGKVLAAGRVFPKQLGRIVCRPQHLLVVLGLALVLLGLGLALGGPLFLHTIFAAATLLVFALLRGRRSVDNDLHTVQKEVLGLHTTLAVGLGLGLRSPVRQGRYDERGRVGGGRGSGAGRGLGKGLSFAFAVDVLLRFRLLVLVLVLRLLPGGSAFARCHPYHSYHYINSNTTDTGFALRFRVFLLFGRHARISARK